MTEAKGGFGSFGANYGASRFDTMQSFGSNYTTPGWQRAQARKARGGGFERRPEDYATRDDATDDARPPPPRSDGEHGGRRAKRRMPLTIEGELVAKSTGTVSMFALGDRVFHQKFGNGNVTAYRRQQAHHRVRQGRRKARGGQLCGAGLIGFRGACEQSICFASEALPVAATIIAVAIGRAKAQCARGYAV